MPAVAVDFENEGKCPSLMDNQLGCPGGTSGAGHFLRSDGASFLLLASGGKLLIWFQV